MTLDDAKILMLRKRKRVPESKPEWKHLAQHEVDVLDWLIKQVEFWKKATNQYQNIADENAEVYEVAIDEVNKLRCKNKNRVALAKRDITKRLIGVYKTI